MTPDDAIALVQKYGKDAQVRVDGYSTWQDAAYTLAGEVERLRYEADKSSIDDAREEIDNLRAALLDQAKARTMLTELAIKNGSIELSADGGMCAVIAASFAEMLKTSSAPNYLEMTFESPSHPDIGQIVVTTQRCSGKTPHQLRTAAEQERDELRRRVDVLEGALKSAQEWLECDTNEIARDIGNNICDWNDIYESTEHCIEKIIKPALANNIEGGE